MPNVRNMEAFARRGNYVGLAIMCKRFVLTVNSLTVTNTNLVYKSGSKPFYSPEKKRLYELLNCVMKSKIIPGRKMNRKLLWRWVNKLTTPLKDGRVEGRRISSNALDTACQMLNSVGQVLDDILVPTTEGEDNGGLAATPTVFDRRDCVSDEAEHNIRNRNENRIMQQMDDDSNRCTRTKSEEEQVKES